MNFEQYDIEKSKDLLKSLINQRVLNLEINQLDSFLHFFIQNSHFERQNISHEVFKEILLKYIQSLSPDEIVRLQSGVLDDVNTENYFISNLLYNPNNTGSSVWGTLKSLSFEEIKFFEERFINETESIDNLFSKAFNVERRKQLKQNLIQLDKENEDVFFDEAVLKAFQLEKRQELKQKLINLDIETDSHKGKVVSIRPFLKAISVAASIILILVVWQPQHSSDKILFADYTNSVDNNSINDFTQAERIREQSGLRGEEEHFRNYSYNETLQLLEAIALVKEKDFQKANEAFNRLQVKKEKNPGLALYLSIAQLNTDNLDDAIRNLEYLMHLPGFSFKDETKFHLAFAYLKSGERKKAKKLLHELINSKSKFSDQAQQTLSKIRWF